MPRTNRHGIPVYPFTGSKFTPKAASNAKAGRHVCVWPECNRPSRPGSPFWPLCMWHAYEIVKGIEDITPHSEYHDKWQEVAEAEDRRVREERRLKSEVLKSRGDHPGWIYYIQFGEQIKIGYSTDVYRRMRSLAANGVLLAEKPADCPHSWADHCPGKRACTWRRCTVPGCRHVEDRNDPERGYDNPAPATSKPEEKP